MVALVIEANEVELCYVVHIYNHDLVTIPQATSKEVLRSRNNVEMDPAGINVIPEAVRDALPCRTS